MKWLPLIFGGLFGVVLREIGGWAPRWASKLVMHRAKGLEEGDREAFIDAAESRLTEIPGDWAKLLFATVRLRIPKTRMPGRVWTWPSMPRSVELTADVLPAVIGGLAMALTAATILKFAWYVTVPFSTLWTLLIFNLDRIMWSSSFQLGGWRRNLSAIAQAIPRLIIAVMLAHIVADLLLMTVFSHEIDRYLDVHTPHDRGLLRHVQALNHVRDSNPSTYAYQYALGAIIVMIELLPFVLRLFKAIAAKTGRHRAQS